MTRNNIASDRSHWGTKTRPLGEPLLDHAEMLDDAKIAALSRITIAQMNRDELLRVIRASRLPLLTTTSDEHLEFHDRNTLERLVYLARRCCRNRSAASQSRRSVVQGREWC
ncbi:MAG TPA: hypothetical protein VL475_14820 [Planctomycetaceae bacterium]|nr:hypothetical protein [Planctomycetaceae bacterium]